MEYTLIRSRRRTLAIEIRPDLTVVVRAPLHTGKREIESLLDAAGINPTAITGNYCLTSYWAPKILWLKRPGVRSASASR